jgi:hypothetical protein
MQDVLTRGGLVFQFTAFYLVATQVIGDANLTKYSNSLYKRLRNTRNVVIAGVPEFIGGSISSVWILATFIGYTIYLHWPSAFKGWPPAIEPFAKNPTFNLISENFWKQEFAHVLLTGLIVGSLAVIAVAVTLALIIAVRVGRLIAGSTRYL